MKYPLAERFKAPQGEGLFAGTQMAFMRLVGCSVGQGVCTHCDTDFDKVYEQLGGGLYDADELLAWAHPCEHVCVTGGEPLDRDLRDLLKHGSHLQWHVETSGTVHPTWLDFTNHHAPGKHMVQQKNASWFEVQLWLTVSPKPGWLTEMIAKADEVKVILGGLGDGPGWPGLDDALAWASQGKLVYVQPRNARNAIDRAAMDEALAVVATYPQLRLSTQLHKYIRTR